MKVAHVHDPQIFPELVVSQSWYNINMTIIIKNKGLTAVFKRYRKRYIVSGKKPDNKKFFPKILYRTMRLEGEKITKKEAKALFR